MIQTLDLNFQGHSETVAAFLVVSNDEVALVETGPHSTFETLKTACQAAGHPLETIKKVFLSHIHFDHAGAAWTLAAMGATIYVHPFGEKHLIDPSKLYNSARQIYKDEMDTLWGKMEGIAPERLHATQHGEKIPLGNSEMIAWHTPGHAVHHIAWQFEQDLFVGDVGGCKIGTGIVVPPCPPPDVDVEAWVESILLMKNLPVKRLHLTHFGQVTQIKKHLNQLERRLKRWANWMKPRYEKGLTANEITPQFQAFTDRELTRYGIVGEHKAQYDSANPAWMSVMGLMRYWHKKKI
ncbi:MAG: MBL fold metallo-hydrolase [Saprospiraceae bacterium]|nr:MBL fold metallo-hydrolase [Saprospiraceae bacterium]